jgi:hypothetical protein
LLRDCTRSWRLELEENCLVNKIGKFINLCRACNSRKIDFLLARKVRSTLKLHRTLLLCDVELTKKFLLAFPLEGESNFCATWARDSVLLCEKKLARDVFPPVTDQKNKVIIIPLEWKIQHQFECERQWKWWNVAKHLSNESLLRSIWLSNWIRNWRTFRASHRAAEQYDDDFDCYSCWVAFSQFFVHKKP